jgi:hypothetical protein
LSTTDRLRDLVHAGIALNSELSVEAVLVELLRQGSTLTGASRAAVTTVGDVGDENEKSLGNTELLSRVQDPTDATLLTVRVALRNAPYATLVLGPTKKAARGSRPTRSSSLCFWRLRRRSRSRMHAAMSRYRVGCTSSRH